MDQNPIVQCNRQQYQSSIEVTLQYANEIQASQSSNILIDWDMRTSLQGEAGGRQRRYCTSGSDTHGYNNNNNQNEGDKELAKGDPDNSQVLNCIYKVSII